MEFVKRSNFTIDVTDESKVTILKKNLCATDFLGVFFTTEIENQGATNIAYNICTSATTMTADKLVTVGTSANKMYYYNPANGKFAKTKALVTE